MSSSSSGLLKTDLDFSPLKGLYGREREMGELKDIFNSVSGDQGLRTQVVLIHGSSGTGKSALCRCFKESMSPTYVEGKFNPISNEPFSAFSQAFSGISDLLATMSARELTQIRKTFCSEEDRENEVISRGNSISSVPENTTQLVDSTDDHQMLSSYKRRAVSMSSPLSRHMSRRNGASSLPKTIRPSDRAKSDDSMTQRVKSVVDFSRVESLSTVGCIRSIAPSMERLIPKNIFATSNSIDRMKHSCRSLLRAICSQSKPIVLCLRGLQWADQSSMHLFDYLVRDSNCRGLMIFGCYRDDEELQPYLKSTLRAIEGLDHVKAIHIENLKQSDLHSMIADVTLTSGTMSKTAELAKVVYLKTNGNPFFAIEFLRMLVRESYMWMNYSSCEYEFDVAKIRDETSVAENVADLISSVLRSLPSSSQDVLRVGACLGSHCDLAAIAAILGLTVSEVKHSLLRPARQRLIEMPEINSFKWAHDKVQQSAFDLLPTGSERLSFYLTVGNALKKLAGSSKEELAGSSKEEWVLFLAAEHLNRAVDLITDDRDKMELVLLNTRAAEQASQRSALVDASRFLNAALNLMGDSDSRWSVHYDLTLRVSIKLADIECIVGRFTSCDELISQVLANATSLEDKLPAYFSQVEFLTAKGDLKEAVNLGIKILKTLGVSISRMPNKLRSVVEFVKVRRMLKAVSREEILQFPSMTDARKIAAMQMLSKTASRAWLTGQLELTASLCLRGIQLTCRHGQTWASSHSFAALGAMCANSLNYSAATRFGDISLAMVEQHAGLQHAARPLLIYLTYIHHLQNPLQMCLDPMISAFKTAMNSGDIDVAHECIANYVAAYVLVGLPLSVIEDDAKRFVEQLESYNRRLSLWFLRIYWQYILCFMSEDSSNPTTLTGKAMDQDEASTELTVTSQRASLRALWTMRMILSYHFNDFELAEEMGCQLIGTGLSKGHFTYYSQNGYLALTKLALARNAHNRKKRGLVREAIQYMSVIRGMLNAKNLNVLHMFYLCVAEQASLDPTADVDDVKMLYGKAIATASRTGILHGAAVANERAGEFLLHRGDALGAEMYFRQARDRYWDWGAYAKVLQLQAKHQFSTLERNRKLSPGFLARKKFSEEEANKHKVSIFSNGWKTEKRMITSQEEPGLYS